MIQLQFFYLLPYSWGSINDCIMNTWYKLCLSFSIAILWTFMIHRNCCLYFSSWIRPTYSCIFYIVTFKNIISIIICLLKCGIVNISDHLFSSWICPTYSFIFYIVTFKNIISIRICLFIFCILNLSNLLFWKNMTPIIIKIYICHQILYICHKILYHDV